MVKSISSVCIFIYISYLIPLSIGGWVPSKLPINSIVDIIGTTCVGNSTFTTCLIVGTQVSTALYSKIFRLNFNYSVVSDLKWSTVFTLNTFTDPNTHNLIIGGLKDIASYRSLQKFYFVSISETGQIYLSLNNGNGWMKILQTSSNLYGVSIGINGFAFAVGKDNSTLGSPIIYRSNHSAYSIWKISLHDSFVNQTQLNGVSTFDGRNVIAVGQSGRIYYSLNSGEHWNISTNGHTLCNGSELFGVSIATQDNSYAAISAGSGGCVLKSTDYGKSWSRLHSSYFLSYEFKFHSVSVLSKYIAYLCGQNGKILRTFNGGSTWFSDLTAPSNRVFYSIYMIDYNRGVAGSDLDDTNFMNVYLRLADLSYLPTSLPSFQPSSQPSRHPTKQPSSQPSLQPACLPTSHPSYQPSMQPTLQPTRKPTKYPSIQPSHMPTRKPSAKPSDQPSYQPFNLPTQQPGGKPSKQPNTYPSRLPSQQPYKEPTSKPSLQPSLQPTYHPSLEPSDQPTSQPSKQPSSQPTFSPHCFPSEQPSILPTIIPSLLPSSLPTSQPTTLPSVEPSIQPSSQPSSRPTSSFPTSVPTGFENFGSWVEKPRSQVAGQTFAGSYFYKSASWSSVRICVVVGGQTSANSNGIIVYTADGGSSWKKSTFSITNAFFHDVAHYNKVGGGTYYVATDSKGRVYNSEDNGVLWPYSTKLSSKSLNGISIDSRGNAWCISRNELFNSSVASNFRVWDTVISANSFLSSSDIYGISLFSNKIVLVGAFGFIALCTFQPVICKLVPTSNIAQSSQYSNLLFAVSAIGNSVAYATGTDGTVLRTLNGGNTWNKTTISTGNWINGLYGRVIFSFTEAVTFVVTAKGQMYVTNNRGYKWSNESNVAVSKSLPLYMINMASTNLGVVGGSIGNLFIKVPVPSSYPTQQPSSFPSCQPALFPTSQPSIKPSKQSSGFPTSQPFSFPSILPTQIPTDIPTQFPVSSPSNTPSGQPFLFPSVKPSLNPSHLPSKQPSRKPESQPSFQPYIKPSCQPFGLPSLVPSLQPTFQPTSQPRRRPSAQPATIPTSKPSVPTNTPSRHPISSPSCQPTFSPISIPSILPSTQPAFYPTRQPLNYPTNQPSLDPTSQPTLNPQNIPSIQPTSQPAIKPTNNPTKQPTTAPTRKPSSQPYRGPSGQPTRQPIRKPSNQPIKNPSSQPSKQPVRYPSSQPPPPRELFSISFYGSIFDGL